MQDTLHIRRAASTDSVSVANLLSQLGYPASPEDASTRIAYMSGEYNALFVAVLSGHVCGLVGMHIYPALHCTGNLAKITALVVAEGFRKRGVGTALLDAAKEFARQYGAGRIEVTSGNHRRQAHDFYRANAYSSTDQTKFVLNLLTQS